MSPPVAQVMESTGADYNSVFRILEELPTEGDSAPDLPAPGAGGLEAVLGELLKGLPGPVELEEATRPVASTQVLLLRPSRTPSPTSCSTSSSRLFSCLLAFEFDSPSSFTFLLITLSPAYFPQATCFYSPTHQSLCSFSACPFSSLYSLSPPPPPQHTHTHTASLLTSL